jgi:DNA ligase D-like protein (predicted 3'-phosphoesterase)
VATRKSATRGSPATRRNKAASKSAKPASGPSPKAAAKAAATRTAKASGSVAKKSAKAGGAVAKKSAKAAKSSTGGKKLPPALAEYRRKRNFSRTAEPEGAPVDANLHPLRFVIQKHAASHLHFDFRLELDGVMKSWAVPKGPSMDPAVKRLAMQVEDHPIEYNTFEGIIPQGEYGGGTVMLWDRGSYTWWQPDPDPVERLRESYTKGDFKFVLLGERLRGSFVLVRTRRGNPDKPQWLLIKHKDEYAEAGSDIVADEVTSVDTGRTMDGIRTGKSRVWGSNR